MKLLRDEEKEQIKAKVLDIQMILANIEKENKEQVGRKFSQKNMNISFILKQ